MKSVLDPTFKYTSSVDTDLKRTFARIRKQQARAEQRKAEAAQKVLPIAIKRTA